LGNWTGTFTWRFHATPNAANIDGVVTLATSGNIDAFTDNAVLIRFNDAGSIDARNGADYDALVTYPYAAGTTCEFTVVVNVAARTYSVDVRPVGGSFTRIATNWAFRTEQNGISDIDYMGWVSNPGSFRIQNVTIQTGSDTVGPPSPPTGLRTVP
jgi:unsaturated chondroitin disaccharide hydrolase